MKILLSLSCVLHKGGMHTDKIDADLKTHKYYTTFRESISRKKRDIDAGEVLTLQERVC